MMNCPNELRKELQALCLQVVTWRSPAIRRSRNHMFLYAVDLPRAADNSSVAKFIELACSLGWTVSAAEDWLQMDKSVRCPPRGWYYGQDAAEAACCLSLLVRHADCLAPSDGLAERQLVKAAETGTEAYQKACRSIHEAWAKRLRKGDQIPDVDPDYFRGGESIC